MRGSYQTPTGLARRDRPTNATGAGLAVCGVEIDDGLWNTGRTVRLAAIVLGPALLAFALVSLAELTLERPAPPTDRPDAMVWDGRVFGSSAEFAKWLNARGLSYARWEEQHPGSPWSTPPKAAPQPAEARDAAPASEGTPRSIVFGFAAATFALAIAVSMRSARASIDAPSVARFAAAVAAARSRFGHRPTDSRRPSRPARSVPTHLAAVVNSVRSIAKWPPTPVAIPPAAKAGLRRTGSWPGRLTLGLARAAAFARALAAAYLVRGRQHLEDFAFASGGYGQLVFLVLAFAASAALGVAAALVI